MPGSRLLMPVTVAARGAQLALAVPVAYLTVLTGAAWIATATTRKRDVGAPSDRHLVVLVPAHDEAAVISETVGALLASDHPRERFEVRVLADHCSDDTAALARSAGAVVEERVGGARGKGPTLAWGVERRTRDGRRVDAFVVVDADTIVAPAFLGEIDRLLGRGARVVQGQYRVRDADRSSAAGLRAVALALRHHVRPLGRTTIGASSGLYGNGMAFATDLLAGREWADHLTEDVALQMELLLDEDVLVAYAPAAVVEAEMPVTLEASRSQHERWERGRLDVGRRFLPRLARRAITGPRRVATADAALDHLVPPLSVLVVAVATVSLANAGVSWWRRRSAWSSIVLPAAMVAHVASGLALGRLPFAVSRSLLGAPRMVVWKLAMWCRVLLERRDDQPSEWIRTDHVGAAHGTRAAGA